GYWRSRRGVALPNSASAAGRLGPDPHFVLSTRRFCRARPDHPPPSGSAGAVASGRAPFGLSLWLIAADDYTHGRAAIARLALATIGERECDPGAPGSSPGL